MRRVALIGAGPKALHALERLVAELRAAPTELEVDAFDPAVPGAGPAYAPTLDPALLMNLRAAAIDAWPRTGPHAIAVDDDHPDFTRWCALQGIAAADYLPRAVVGEYLAAAWERVVADAPPALRIRHSPHRIGALRADPVRPATWWLGPERADRGPYDEVLLATGHGAPAHGDARALPLAALAAHTLIAVRGAGLTALDVVRGLAARRARGAAGPQVVLVSRTARPLTPKPLPSLDARWRAQLDERRGALAPRLIDADTIQRVLIDDAAALLRGPAARAGARAALDELCARAPMDQRAALAAIERWLRAATAGGELDDPVLALGAAFRWRYPQLVEQASEGGLPPQELARFRRLAAAMEPVAFGPPLRRWARCAPRSPRAG